MASPGRLITKNGKATYQRLDTVYDGDEEDKSFGVRNYPHDGIVWPEYDSSWLSRLFFLWYNPLVEYGQHVALEQEHTWLLHENDSATKLYPRFHRLWDNEVQRIRQKKAQQAEPVSPDDPKFRPGLFRPIFLFGIGQVAKAGCILLLSVCMQFARPLLMQQILLVVENDPEHPAIVGVDDAWMLAVAIAIASVVDFLAGAHYQITTWKGMLRMRQGIVGLLFWKVTKLSPGTKASYSQGKITNMMSNDADRVRMCVRVINNLWTIPLRFGVALYLIVDILGSRAAFSGLIVMIALIPVTRTFMRKLRGFQRSILKYTDDRIKKTQEVMSGIRIIKLMAWEASFASQVKTIRDDELRMVRKSAVYRALFYTVAMSVPIIIVTVTLGVYTMVDGNTLTPSTAFPALSLLDTLRGPLQEFPRILTMVVVEGRVSLDRLNAFLNEADIDEYVIRGPTAAADQLCVDVRDATFRWAPGNKAVWDANNRYKMNGGIMSLFKKDTWTKRVKLEAIEEDTDRGPCLFNQDFQMHQGRLNCIIGQVGSGKTSLLHAILGELEKTSGSVTVNGTISYAAQSSYVMNMTLRDNVLFGSEYDAEKYQKVLFACALTDDLDQLPAGDMTQIGEKGINLSGGQKQRVGLARAVYKDADIYLLDDPLSAVDAHTGQHIMDHVILGRLKGKTVILPCHALGFLSHADWIISLERGRIIEQGTYRGLLSAGGDFSRLMQEHASVDCSTDDHEAQAEKPPKEDEAVEKRKKKDEEIGGQGKSGKLMQVEERAKGTVDKSVFAYYIAQIGKVLVLFVVALYILGNFVRVFRDWWMSRWAVRDIDLVVGYDLDWTENEIVSYFLTIYAASGFTIIAFTAVRTIIIQIVGLGAARKLHEKMLWRLLKSPVSFFDQTPVGRIVNRFTSDFQTIDRDIADNFVGVARSVLDLLSAFAVIVTVLPPFFIWILPMLIMYFRLQKKYRKTAREIKRINSNSRSPIFQHFNETIAGLITMRAFGETPHFQAKCGKNIDNFSRTMMCQMTIGRWLSVRLQGLGCVTLFFTALVVTIFPELLDAGLAGLAINYSMMVSGTLQGFIESFTELELKMNGIERVKYYTEVATEKPYEKDTQAKLDDFARRIVQAPKSWPQYGAVVFDRVCARYRPELDMVLSDVSFEVSPGEKVGVCGRTGSGKSSLMLTLFRILELDEKARGGGTISIDGQDISKLGLTQLRTAIAMLPQDPTLFSGSIRVNIDPFGEHDDERLWLALEKAQLKDAIEAMPQKLDSDVGDGGDSLSVGERQLLCLARAVLRDSKILVMDECTASVDVRTDAKIQIMIREVFAQCTVFAIAHRLGTIIDYDKVAVLQASKLVEFGAPAELLRVGHDGPFSKLIDRTGPSLSAHLRAVALGLTEFSAEALAEMKEGDSTPKSAQSALGSKQQQPS